MGSFRTWCRVKSAGCMLMQRGGSLPPLMQYDPQGSFLGRKLSCARLRGSTPVSLVFVHFLSSQRVVESPLASKDRTRGGQAAYSTC
jgi:hypothetical protein